VQVGFFHFNFCVSISVIRGSSLLGLLILIGLVVFRSVNIKKGPKANYVAAHDDATTTIT